MAQVKALDRFFDTNILIYLLSADDFKAGRSERILALGGVISVQVLNEFVAVASRKKLMTYDEIDAFLTSIRSILSVRSMTVATHELGLDIARRHGFSIYDALIIAAALEAGCECLYTEDLQHEQVINRRLTIINPFRERS